MSDRKIKMRFILSLVFILLVKTSIIAGVIDHFELLNTNNGLSQNAALSIYSDSRGYIWVGTMDGLNRYDGYNFKIYKSHQNDYYSLTNNRVIFIWEDKKGFIWVETHDGYYHYLDCSSDKFFTYPRYQDSDDERNSKIQCFTQLNDNEIWLGSSSSGAYRLRYNPKGYYDHKQFKSNIEPSLSDNQVNFIDGGLDNSIWIGTADGLNKLKTINQANDVQEIKTYYKGINFTSSDGLDDYFWFGTRKNGIIKYNQKNHKFSAFKPDEAYASLGISVLHTTRDKESMVIGTYANGLFVYDVVKSKLKHYSIHGSEIKEVYEDYYGMIWVVTEQFGVTRIDLSKQTSNHYDLTPNDIQSLIDAERPFFYEDHEHNLWIGVHGGGLAMFDRNTQKLIFYRNDPDDPNSLSSNFVLSINEDQSGLLWVGTGQFNGGLNKAIPENPTFRKLNLKKKVTDLSENVIRYLYEDQLSHVWVATKSGELYIYDSNFNLLNTFSTIPLTDRNIPGFNIYSILQDSKGFIWLGSKGGGIAVSTKPLAAFHSNYDNLKFNLYQYNVTDTTGLSSNNIYSILEDKKSNIWIGTYGGGINRVAKRTSEKIFCDRITRKNSNLSSNEIRKLFQDSDSNLWIATTFGVNLLTSDKLYTHPVFRIFKYEPNISTSISYNDVIYIYEDSKKRLWFTTFGAGLDCLVNPDLKKAGFDHYNEEKGLVNDAVFGIVEDNRGYLWVSTDNGLSRISPTLTQIENFNQNNGLYFDNFCENSCTVLKSGQIIFGATEGALIINPNQIKKSSYAPKVVLSKFFLSNEEMLIDDPKSPITKNIDYYDTLYLKYNQSSFSIEYSALSFFDPEKNQYAYMLENFDKDWQYVHNERKATYTNIAPGEYIFKVKAANWDNSWNNTPRILHIKISPPWWRTRLSYIIYYLLVFMLLEIARRIFLKYNRLSNDLKVEKRVNEIKLQFFTNISHEIRTPLTLILGPAEDLRKLQNLPPSLQHAIEIITQNGQRMLRLVNQLLDFRKIQNKKMKLKITKTEMNQFIKSVCSNFNYLARQKNIDFLYIQQNPETEIWIDPNKIDAVLFNILSNAFKFTPDGKQIKVEASVNKAEDSIEIKVTDQGKGIPESKQALLFQRYTSLSTDQINLSSTGIGLSFALEMVTLHKGEIVVESDTEKGSTFLIKLPLDKNNYEPDEIVSDEIVVEAPKHKPDEIEFKEINDSFTLETVEELDQETKKQLVLLVEDNTEISRYISDVLSNNFRFVFAGNGEKGLNLVYKHNPDLIITDLMMPVMDGMAMTRQIKNDFTISHIPVIMLTAKSTIDDQIEGIESGAEAYLLKPFNATYLRVLAVNLLKQRENVQNNLLKTGNVDFSGIKITTKDEQFLKKTLEIIENNYQESSFNVDKLVEQSNLGRTVFYNKIKSLTGLTPVHFLRNSRLQIAARFLKEADYSVSEVAYMTGFNDVKYFRDCFKQVFDKTPSEFRKEIDENK